MTSLSAAVIYADVKSIHHLDKSKKSEDNFYKTINNIIENNIIY